jgi:cytoskeletal protein RodZ
MSLTLGEKLRQAREARGISISEVAEQTRISALYLESIENNDYRTLPGGIFNKGFVKSYAKYLGLNDQEALQDYAALISEQGSDVNDDPKTYRPEVLTDERSRSGLLPTIIFSIIIVGLMVWGILAFLQNYNSPSQTAADANANKPANTETQLPSPPPSTPVSINEMKVELKTTAPVWVSSVVDDTKKAGGIVNPEKSSIFEPKEKLRLSYSKDQAPNVQLTINGKTITLPTAPANPKQITIDFTITRQNVAQIFQSGALTNETAATAPAAAPARR